MEVVSKVVTERRDVCDVWSRCFDEHTDVYPHEVWKKLVRFSIVGVGERVALPR